MWTRIALAVMLATFYMPTFSQTRPKTKLGVELDTSSCDSRVGTKFAYAFKESLLASHSYEIRSNGLLKLQLVCMNDSTSQEESDNGHSAIVSVIAYWQSPPGGDCGGLHFIVYHAVMQIGASRTEDMAKELIANIDKQLSGGK
jgi:hypothetical protein